ncbi:NAD(P)-dependent oxidoreductase [Oricola cellulosilytica]|uniref:NAD(P)-dependent oxidoreductase n=1 Tax=Oricola cellulosilytica TaxID=1429082 RepID=A0A4R0PF00_9HYPH|nr:NAD(P)-dependent oxidoreductase [Oricola cellulosilytica]TCD14064.1 NAD(P)-dependent oxidoreductase [Oricola cellulosilytica]
MKIAFLGTGLMGAPMARRLAQAGNELRLWNRSREKAEALADVASVHGSPAEAAEGVEVVVSMLFDGASTEAVLKDAGAIEAAAPGALIVNMASTEPERDRSLAAWTRDTGRDFLDCPVSGGVVGAEQGTLVIFAGGEKDVFENAKDVFVPMGRATWLGPSGAGQVAKLANQLIVGAAIGAVAEAFILAERAGCDLKSLHAALRGGFADSRILELHGKRMIARDFTPGGKTTAQLKDLRNVMAQAETSGLRLPIAAQTEAAFADLVENRDGADLDHSAYFRWLELINR